MVRHNKSTVAKVQKIVLLVKSVDRENWPEDKLKIGGFKDDMQESVCKSSPRSSKCIGEPSPIKLTTNMLKVTPKMSFFIHNFVPKHV